MTRYISIAAIFLFSSANAQLLADDIDVLFVFGEDSFSKVTNKATWASGHEDTVNGYLSAAGVGQLNFDFRVHTSQIAFNANGMSAQAVLDWAQSGAGQTIVNSIRGDNDLVVIVVNDYSDGKCGRASRAENNINVLNGNTKFVVTIRLVDCGGDLSQLIAHELGHALYADHQLIYLANGNLDLAGSEQIDPDGNISNPETYNHAWSDISDTYATIMGQGIAAADTEDYFSSGDASRGEVPSDHDIARMFGDGTEFWNGDTSWSTVSKYRPIPQVPVAGTSNLIPCFCIGKEGNQDVTFYSSDTSIPGQSFVVERQQISGNWTTAYEGDPTCFIFDVRPGGAWHRIKILVEGMLDSDWVSIFLPNCGCVGGGGGDDW